MYIQTMYISTQVRIESIKSPIIIIQLLRPSFSSSSVFS